MRTGEDGGYESRLCQVEGARVKSGSVKRATTFGWNREERVRFRVGCVYPLRGRVSLWGHVRARVAAVAGAQVVAFT